MKSLSEETKKISENEYEELFKNRQNVESRELSLDELESVTGGYVEESALTSGYIYECSVKGCRSYGMDVRDLGSSTTDFVCSKHPGAEFLRAYYLELVTPGFTPD